MPTSPLGSPSPALPRFSFADPVLARTGAQTTVATPQERRATIEGLQRDGKFDAAPAAKVPSTTIKVKSGDTLEQLAKDYGTTIAQLAKLNPDIQRLDDLRVGDTLKVPVNRQVVQVQAGQTLTAIAERYGVSVDQLARANGIADPNSIQAGQRIAIVPGHTRGLDSNAQVREYISDMRAIGKDWGKLTPGQRLQRIGDALNERLRASGLPPVKVTLGTGSNASGVYDFSTHSIAVDPALLKQKSIADGQLKELADTFYHEGRHAEQWFDMARLQIARGKDPGELGLPKAVVDAARKAPALDPKSAEGRFVRAHYESVYGSGAAARNDVLGKLASGDYSVYEDYRALPEEADAWRVGGKVSNLWPRS